MGIFDFFKNKKEDVIVRSEEEIERNYKKRGCYTGTPEQQAKIRRLAERKFSAKLKRGVAISCVAAGVVGTVIGGTTHSKDSDNPETKTLIGNEAINTPEEEATQRIQTAKITEKNGIDDINSKVDVLNYFKDFYAKEYNEVNGTNYNSEDIYIYSNDHAFVWAGENFYVTRGSTPYSVEDKIMKEDMEIGSANHVKIYWTMVNTENGKETLEAMSTNGYSSVPVILGDDYVKGKSIDSVNNINVLVDMAEFAEAVIDTAVIYENEPKERISSTRDFYLERLKDGKAVYENNKAERIQKYKISSNQEIGG